MRVFATGFIDPLRDDPTLINMPATMHTTPYPEVNDLLQVLCARIQAALGPKLVGIYLAGSLVYGDFDVATSDIDLLTLITTPLEDAEVAHLKAMHQTIAAEHPRWDDRIETAYVTQDAINRTRTQSSTIANISPGEPFHTLEAGVDWLVNWYLVRARGIALVGPPPARVIAPITHAEYVAVIRRHTRSWAQWVDDCRQLKGQAYAILTLCRALYTLTHGEQLSKLQAAAWAMQSFPQWADLIERALAWRKGAGPAPVDTEEIDAAATFPTTVRFVHFAIQQSEQAQVEPVQVDTGINWQPLP
jgi:hypothetical protein